MDSILVPWKANPSRPMRDWGDVQRDGGIVRIPGIDSQGITVAGQ